MRGFEINIKPSRTRSDFYDVECWPREPQQRYKDGKPQPVPPFPKAEVDVHDGEPSVRWIVFPERFENIKGEIEEAVKDKVKEYRTSQSTDPQPD